MRLNKQCLAAIKDYYFNRNRNLKYKIPWDKQTDLDRIVARKPSTLRLEAAAGTFIFYRGKKELWITEETYPEGIIR